MRAGGREAVAEVLAGARPLADMLWARETEGSALDTPERRVRYIGEFYGHRFWTSPGKFSAADVQFMSEPFADAAKFRASIANYEYAFSRREAAELPCFFTPVPVPTLVLYGPDDHVLPRDKGGRTTWENIVTSCIRCNTRKANKLTHEVNMHPLRKPAAPRWRPMFGLREHGGTDESWTHFIDPDPSSVRMSA